MKHETLYDRFHKKLYCVKKINNFRELIYSSAETYPNRPAFQLKTELDTFKYVTYTELKEQFQTTANAFLKMGLSGKRIAIVGKNSYHWVLGYLSAAMVGVAVPLDKDLSAEDMYNFIKSASCEAVIADDEIRERLSPLCPDSVRFISLQTMEIPDAWMTEEKAGTVDDILISEDEMKVLIFTSGTTSKSKGVCLSQKNICSNIYSTTQMVKVKPIDKTLSILPLHHAYECTLNCLLFLARGGCISYLEGVQKISQNLLEYQPTVLVVVPALLDVMNKRIRKTVAKQCPEKYRALFETYSFADALAKVPLIVRAIICRKVKTTLGGKLRLFIVGAADLSPTLVEDFLVLGIRTLQGYGLTECSPLLAGNNDFYLNPKSTGLAIPGVELKIENPNNVGVGEIIARGDNIMLGYFQDEEATAKAMAGGFFHTGDLGRTDENGFLYIMGRIKNVIVTSNGKNIYPEELETRLKETELVAESLVLGATDHNGEICVKAKILPNMDYIMELLGHLPSEDEIRSAIKNVIEDINNKLPRYKHIRIIEILATELEKTTTRKIRRYGTNLA